MSVLRSQLLAEVSENIAKRGQNSAEPRIFPQHQKLHFPIREFPVNYFAGFLESSAGPLLRSTFRFGVTFPMNVISRAANAIAVLIADSNIMQSQLLTSALRRRSEFHISICKADEASILQAMATSPAQVVLFSLNHSVSTASQMATLRRLHLSYPAIAKILLVETCSRELGVTAFRSGARGIFCIADTHFRLLCRCIQRVAEGQVWATAEQMRFLLDLVSEVPSLRVLNSRGSEMLTPREEQVVALAAEGLSNRDIAGELDLSEHTIKKYLFRIFDKLGVSSRVELVLYAMNHGEPLQAEWLAGGPAPVID
jgi:DNA-binding NarL/FixJ family response regulator